MKKLKTPLASTIKPEQSFFENQKAESSICDEEFLTSKEAAAFLKISEAVLRNKTSSGQIPYYKFFRSNRYKKSDLLNLLLSNKRGA